MEAKNLNACVTTDLMANDASFHVLLTVKMMENAYTKSTVMVL